MKKFQQAYHKDNQMVLCNSVHNKDLENQPEGYSMAAEIRSVWHTYRSIQPQKWMKWHLQESGCNWWCSWDDHAHEMKWYRLRRILSFLLQCLDLKKIRHKRRKHLCGKRGPVRGEAKKGNGVVVTKVHAIHVWDSMLTSFRVCGMYTYESICTRVSKMAQQGKTLATEPNELSSDSATHIMEG